MHVIADPAHSQLGATLAGFASDVTAWAWLLHEYAPKASLRPADVLWIRFPARFQGEQNEYFNDRVEVLGRLAGANKAFRVLPYLVCPPGARPRVEAGQARALHDRCRGGIAFDSSAARKLPPCRRTVIEPNWMLEAPWNHGHDAVMTEDEYRDRFDPKLGTMAPIKERGRTLHMLFHRQVPEHRRTPAGIREEIAEFGRWVTSVSRELSRPGRRGVVPVLPLDLLADYGITAAEAESLATQEEPGTPEVQACPITCSQCAHDASGHHWTRGTLTEADPNHPGAPLDTLLDLCVHCPRWRLVTDDEADQARRTRP